MKLSASNILIGFAVGFLVGNLAGEVIGAHEANADRDEEVAEAMEYGACMAGCGGPEMSGVQLSACTTQCHCLYGYPSMCEDLKKP
jgi:hypothetical protein